jgi:hypothetical protein
MANKVAVIVMVDPEHETTIKPFAAQVAKPINLHTEKASPQVTGSGTVTYQNGGWDGDGTID